MSAADIAHALGDARRRADASSEPPSAHPRSRITSLELTELRRFGGKDASAALRAQIREKPAAGRP